MKKTCLILLFLLFFSQSVFSNYFYVSPESSSMKIYDFVEVNTISSKGDLTYEGVLTFYLDRNYARYKFDVDITVEAFEKLPPATKTIKDFQIKVCGGHLQLDNSYSFDVNCFHDISGSIIYTGNADYSELTFKIPAKFLDSENFYSVYVKYSEPDFLYEANSSTSEAKFLTGCHTPFCPSGISNVQYILIPSDTFKIISDVGTAKKFDFFLNNYLLRYEGKEDIVLILENLQVTKIWEPFFWAFVGALLGTLITLMGSYIYKKLKKPPKKPKESYLISKMIS